MNASIEIKPSKEIFENIHQPIVITSDEKIIYANPAALQLFSATSVDLRNMQLSEYVVLPFKAESNTNVVSIRKLDGQKALAEMIEGTFEYERGKFYKVLLFKEMHTNYQSIEEKMKLLLKTIHKDISRREEEIDRLSAEIEARTNILNAAAIVSETDKFGTITFVNDTFCKISKYSREELIGKPHNIVRHPDMPKAVFKDLWETIKAGKIFQGIIKNRAKDGSPYWVIATIGGVLDSEGKPYKYIGVRIDITELIKKGMQVEQYLQA
ncbi:MAG: PAS domain-containing protein [Raineya sp.]|nr:PAS domain-containing protein [Raineya sp.]MDW8295838.1 PAS domain-containing protein [Raineya sp.]